uniref:Anhydromuropeptide permease n=1 Tax=Providencia stuartii TaxID=588 RepID=A0AAI9GIP5_PROST|nr:MFS transporter [Providencia stuartii]
MSHSLLPKLPNSVILILLGFVSGLPLALTAGTLQAWLTVENVDIKTIGFFSLVGQAYVLKFLWSPMMDRYTPSFLGRRRGWLLTTQILLIISIAAMGFMSPTEHLWWLAAFAVMVAFCSASQDVVFDAYKTDLLSAEERGFGAAVSVMGYRISMLVSGGLALWMADKFLTWQQLYMVMAGLMLIGVFATLFAKEPEDNGTPPASLKDAIYKPLSEFFSRNNAWLVLLLIVFYKMGDAFVMALSTNFLLSGLGFTLSEVAAVNKTVGMAATIFGALFGGYLMKNMSLFNALLVFGILQGASNIGYWFLAVTPPNIISMGSIIVIENIFSGMGTAAFVALLMTLCNKSLSATQFALLSALSAIARVYIGPVASIVVLSYGWPTFYLISIVVAVPSILLLLACKTSLAYTQTTGLFQRRELYPQAYKIAVYILLAAIGILALWLLTLLFTSFASVKIYLFTNYISLWLALPEYKNFIFNTGASIGALSLIIGGCLDFFAVRKIVKK